MGNFIFCAVVALHFTMNFFLSDNAVFSGPHSPVFGPEKTLYLDILHTFLALISFY